MTEAEPYAPVSLARSGTVPVASSLASELAVQAQGGDTHARDRLVAANMRFVFKLARRYQHAAAVVDYDDLVSEGAIGLLDAIRKFEPERGIAFITYAGHWIQMRMRRAIATHRTAFKAGTTYKERISAKPTAPNVSGCWRQAFRQRRCTKRSGQSSSSRWPL